MTTIAKALHSLGIKEWALNGTPTNEKEFNLMFTKIIGEKDGAGIESSDPKDFGVTWKQVSDKKTELVNAEPMRLLRVERDRLLAETDWMGNSDVTMSSDWKTYRTKLRDLPASAKPKLSADG